MDVKRAFYRSWSGSEGPTWPFDRRPPLSRSTPLTIYYTIKPVGRKTTACAHREARTWPTRGQAPPKAKARDHHHERQGGAGLSSVGGARTGCDCAGRRGHVHWRFARCSAMRGHGGTGRPPGDHHPGDRPTSVRGRRPGQPGARDRVSSVRAAELRRTTGGPQFAPCSLVPIRGGRPRIGTSGIPSSGTFGDPVRRDERP
jgi:hypothetical protein